MRNRIISSLFHSTHTVKLYSIDDLRKILSRERARSDRNNHEFSMIVFQLESIKLQKMLVTDFCRFLASRLRSTDEIGWFAQNQIGVVLPYTAAADASALANDIHAQLQYRNFILKIQIFAYPTVWPFKKTTHDLSKMGQRRER